jgi:tripartite-type tricarboxylate transporter receptor subunit TctC
MTVRTLKTFGALTAVAFAAGALLTPTVASAVDFKGKKVTAVVPFKEGGGTDKIVRMFAPFFAEYLPGKPTVIIRNMPGGGSIRGNNWFHNNAKPDGLSFTGVSTSSQTGYVLGGKKVKYDLRKWRYILSTPRGTIVYARPETGVKGKDIRADVMALRKAKLVTGAKNPTSAELRLFLGLELLGAKSVKPVFGLSTGKQRKAILRGELNINYDTGGAYLTKVKKKYADKGKVVPIMTLGYTRGGKIIRDPGYPNLPTIVDAYKAANGGKMPSGPLWEAYKNFYTMGVMTSKGFALPPKTPQKVVDAYIKAAKGIIKDKKFWKIAKKRLGNYPIDFGKDAKQNFMDAVDVKPEVRAFMKTFIKQKFDANI